MSASTVQRGIAASGRVRSLLADGVRALEVAGLPTARQDAEWLLADLLGVDRFALYIETLPAGKADARRYAEAVARRAAHEPLQYLLGWEKFRGLRLRVDRAVLVPRPETELLVEWALALAGPGAAVCDVGTGSGCIACALAVARPDIRVLAIDRSPAALAVAAANVAAHGLGGRVVLLGGDLLESLRPAAGRIDLVVANPPYIPSDLLATLPAEVALWEPREALDGGVDGTLVARRIVAGAPAVLRAGGALVMEVGDGQGAPLAAVMWAAGFGEIAVRRDLHGVERYVGGRLPLGRAG